MTSTFRTLTSVTLLLLFAPVTADAFRSVDAARPTRAASGPDSGTAASRGWQPTDPSTLRWSTVTAPFAVRLSYPSNWDYRLSSDGLFLLRPQQSDETDPLQLQPYLSLSSLPAYTVNTPALLHTWFMNKATLATNQRDADWYVPSFQLQESGSVVFAGKQALRYDYTGESGSTPFRAIQYTWLEEGRMVHLRFLSPLSRFADDVLLFDRMIAASAAAVRTDSSSSSPSSRSSNVRSSTAVSFASSSPPVSRLRASALRRRLMRQKTMAERRQLRLQLRLQRTR